MGRKVIVESSTTKTTGGKYGKGNYDNMGRTVIIEATTETVTKKGGYGSGYGSSSGAGSSSGNGNMSRKVIVETTTTTTKGGKGGSGYSIENVTLNKSGNEKDWKSKGGLSGSGTTGIAIYKEEKKVSKATGGKRPWELEVTNGDEVFTGRHPSDEEVSTGGKKDSKFQPSKGASFSKGSKFAVKRTGNVITKGY